MRSLTFTRYVAALIVVFFHFGGGVDTGPSSWINVLRQGPAMVAYFFVLSGFILGVVYGVPADAQARRRFWIARLARIYPVYLLALALTMLLQTAAGDRVSGSGAVLQATMLQAWVPNRIHLLNYPGWSLSIEVFFYAVFPVIAWGLFRVRSSAGVVVIAMACWSFSWLVGEVGDRLAPRTATWFELLHYNPLMHLNSFVIGVATAVLLRRHELTPAESRWLGSRNATVLWIGALLLVALFFIVQPALMRAAPLWMLYLPTLGSRIEDGVLHFVVFAGLLTATSVAITIAFERPARAWVRRALQPAVSPRTASFAPPMPGRSP